MYQKTCIFHLILLGVPSRLVLSVKNKRCFTKRGGLLNRKNLSGMMKVIWWSPKEKITQTLFEIKIKYEFQSATWSDCKHHKQLVFFCCLCCFPIQLWSCHNNIVTERGLNLFHDCAVECVGRRVYFFFVGYTVKCTLLAPLQIYRHRGWQLK